MTPLEGGVIYIEEVLNKLTDAGLHNVTYEIIEPIPMCFDLIRTARQIINKSRKEILSPIKLS